MSNLLDDAIDAVYDKNPSAFQDAVGGVLQDKLRETIGVEKISISQNFMSDNDYDNDEQEEAADEDF